MMTTGYPNLSDADADVIMAALDADGVDAVEKLPEPGGTFTVVATVTEPSDDAARVKLLLREAMTAAGFTSPADRAGIAAIAGGESGFQPRSELGYGHTDVSRIRKLFGQRVAGFADPDLKRLSGDDEAFFNTVYGGDWGRAHLGNTTPGDGYRYRGRGIFQLTGRGNYNRYGAMLQLDLVDNPDLANTIEAATRIAVVYVKDRYHGGGFAAMKAAVGNSVGAPDAVKNSLFQQYLQSGEYAV